VKPLDRSSGNFCAVQIPCDRGSLLLWRRCDMLCTSGRTDDVIFGRSGPYGDELQYRDGVWCLWMLCHFCRYCAVHIIDISNR